MASPVSAKVWNIISFAASLGLILGLLNLLENVASHSVIQVSVCLVLLVVARIKLRKISADTTSPRAKVEKTRQDAQFLGGLAAGGAVSALVLAPRNEYLTSIFSMWLYGSVLVGLIAYGMIIWAERKSLRLNSAENLERLKI